MREDEAGRSPTTRPWQPWFKRISSAAAHVSAATLLAAGVANGLAARKHNRGSNHPGQRDQASTDGHGGNDQNRADNQGNDHKADRRIQREHQDRSHGDGGGKQEHQVDESSDVHSPAAKQAATSTPTPTPTSTPTGNNGGGGGGGGKGHGGGGNGDGGGGKGDGGGNPHGNAGSGFFDSPLATKARRRAKDFDNADHNDEDDRTVVDVHPDGKSTYKTHSVALTTGPDGLDIETDHISYTAEPTPTPTPFPTLELPVHEPGFPFGEDFPFGNTAVNVTPAAPAPSDSGDTTTAPAPRAEPIPAANQPEPISSDGGDNSMGFTS